MKLLPPTVQLSTLELKDEIVLATNDGKRYTAKKSVFLGSSLVREMLASEVRLNNGAEPTEPLMVTLTDEVAIDSTTLYAVFEYLDHHATLAHSDRGTKHQREIERPLKNDLRASLDSWDWKYVEDTLMRGGKDKKFVFGVLQAATHLGIPELRELCCACIAEILKYQSEEEILEFFGCPEGFTAAEEEELTQEFPWLAEHT